MPDPSPGPSKAAAVWQSEDIWSYVSSYPTLWSVFDMLTVLAERKADKYKRSREKGENGLTPITSVPHYCNLCPLRDL